MPMTTAEIARLLRKPNVAVVAVTAPDRSPHAVPTWYEYRAGEIAFHTATESFKYRCLRRNPRVALVVDIKRPPYKAVVLKGRVRMKIQTDDARVRRMAVAYLGRRAGEAYARSLRGERMVLVRFKPSRIISWDYAKESP
jgi:PPOX class probable F420-dependent enzyme